MKPQFLFHKTPIFLGTKSLDVVAEFLIKNKSSHVYILVDANTQKYCLPILLTRNPTLSDAKVIKLPIGESTKSLIVFEEVCVKLLQENIDRDSLIINLGGGVVCDFGGFLSSSLKRGIKFINIPTTLMAQIDAGFGGKVGLNLKNYKNQIGLFSNPDLIIIYPPFLLSLPNNEFLSAQAEIFKYGIVKNMLFWDKIISFNFSKKTDLTSIIKDCVKIKIDIIGDDYIDLSKRRKLNFGHTISHAIESVFLEKGHNILHGFALSIGLICESYISHVRFGLSLEKLNLITSNLLDNFGVIKLNNINDELILKYIYSDKKNLKGRVYCTLINDIGSALVNCPIESEDILSALEFYREKCRV